ncbi:hypothetical protein CTAYLR_007059 [Chrysophaeum taylorii]|uniref:Glycosyltransferase 61 catalytic domain-containing protein n=1 Tax=Chrysophaeum taylorii TaxID=2483200 RepID=A0AAD7UL16_9STRA|nr:hypothetical protein CTAYLR_007059 [Chrysophaeum taylorii]
MGVVVVLLVVVLWGLTTHGKTRVRYLSGYPAASVKVVAAQQWLPPGSRESLLFSTAAEKAAWCRRWWATVEKSPKVVGKRWSRICPAPASKQKATREARQWSACRVKRFVAAVTNGEVTVARDKPAGGAIVANRTHAFPVHLNTIMSSPRTKITSRFDVPIAHTFGGLSVHAAHLINQIPRLVALARNVPRGTKVLVFNTRLHREFVDLFRRRDVIPQHLEIKFVPPAARTFSAPTVYFAGEAVETEKGWYTLEEEICSWQLTTNRTEIRDLLDAGLGKEDTVGDDAPVVCRAPGRDDCGVEALVVSREDATSRSVKNHDDLLRAVRTALADSTRCAVTVRVFVGRDHRVAATERIWRRADLVVAPHGAALAFMLFMRPGTHVIELGYYYSDPSTTSWKKKKKEETNNNGALALSNANGMPWPAPYYWVVAVSASVHLYASMARGSYGGPMTANLSDVARVVANRVAPALRFSRSKRQQRL